MHLGCYIFYFFGWCVLLYFILWVGIVQNSNLIWIQMNWKLRKDLEIRKVFLFSIWPWAKIDFPQKWPSRTAPSPPLLGPTRPTSALPGPDPTQWPGISSDLAGLTLHRVLHGGFYPLSVLNRFLWFEAIFEVKRDGVHVGYDLGSNPLYIVTSIVVIRTHKLETLALFRTRVSVDPLMNWNSRRAWGEAAAPTRSLLANGGSLEEPYIEPWRRMKPHHHHQPSGSHESHWGLPGKLACVSLFVLT
jgi:hypothetical protein